ncbi:MAG TPA: hypothetical protein VMV18_00480 [bacterium]|nr:hypothetical protein [bacterium]
MRARALFALVVGLACIGAFAWWALHKAPPHGVATVTPATTNTRVSVPFVRPPIKIDSELDEDAWHNPGRTGPFHFPGSTEQARPYSDARFLRDTDNLYLALYAADQDIHRGSDAFTLAFLDPKDGAILTMRLSVDKVVQTKRVKDGVESPWDANIRLAVDSDGTFDDPSDEDEEWIIEAALPWKSLDVDAHTREIKASIARCDVPKGSPEACGEWGVGPDGGVAGVLVIDGGT